MKPILFYIGPLPVYSFGAMIALGVFLSLFLMNRKSKRTGFPAAPELTADLVFTGVLSGFLGGRLFYVFENAAYYWREPLRIFSLWEGGLIFYGGVAGALAGLFWTLKVKKIPYWKGLDFLIPYVAIIHAFGRVGCFLNGCCEGKLCDLPWAVTVEGVKLHPVQLYEAAFNGLLFLFLNARYEKKKFEGEIIALYFILYAAGRFVFEFFRVNPGWILSYNQWESLALLAAGGMIYMRRRKGSLC
ncbi:MAG TPA: prolipoprotein diacylglyceryl transferase [bacterium]|nr:prolipoprotein diacylglyceryl transferase [bacterium]